MILCLETTADVCSVALAENGRLVSLVESLENHSHATQLTVCCQRLLDEAGLRVADLDAVAVSMGPGSYTGLRIGVSTAKGMCYGVQIPLLAVPTLDVLVAGFLEQHQQELDAGWRLVPMIDARRMEVYTALYSMAGERLDEVHAAVIDAETYRSALEKGPLAFFGTGAVKCAEVIGSENTAFYGDIRPSAAYMCGLAEREFKAQAWRSVAYFEPYYLKDFLATKAKSLW